MVHPLFDQPDLLVALWPFRQSEVVADGRAADFNAAQERVPLELDEVIVAESLWEIVARQFRAGAAVVAAVVHEIIERDLFGRVFVREKLAEGIGREAELKPRFA